MIWRVPCALSFSNDRIPIGWFLIIGFFFGFGRSPLADVASSAR